MQELDNLIEILMKDTHKKNVIICLNCVLNFNSIDNLKKYVKSNEITVNGEENPSKEYLIYEIYNHFYNEFNSDSSIQEQYGSPIHYIGEKISNPKSLLSFPEIYDFIAKQDLIEVFSDFCADIGINTFDLTSIKKNKFEVDLFLTKKLGRDLFKTKTEAVFVRTGYELENGYNQELLEKIKNASKCTFWTVFVTTSYGAYSVGLDKLIKDMEALNVWLYIVDPVHKNVFGITKGKKNDVDEMESADLIKLLPKEPVRAPNPLGKISTYAFSEKNSYNSKKFDLFGIVESELMGLNDEDFYKAFEPKFSDIFSSILIIDNRSGLSLFSYSSEKQRVDDMIVSGFLSAIDSFALELTGGTKSDLKEINYKGFKVQLVTNQDVKIAVFLTEQPPRSFLERLDYFLESFCIKFKSELDLFKKTSSASLFESDLLRNMIKKILSI